MNSWAIWVITTLCAIAKQLTCSPRCALYQKKPHNLALWRTILVKKKNPVHFSGWLKVQWLKTAKTTEDKKRRFATTTCNMKCITMNEVCAGCHRCSSIPSPSTTTSCQRWFIMSPNWKLGAFTRKQHGSVTVLLTSFEVDVVNLLGGLHQSIKHFLKIFYLFAWLTSPVSKLLEWMDRYTWRMCEFISCLILMSVSI